MAKDNMPSTGLIKGEKYTLNDRFLCISPTRWKKIKYSISRLRTEYNGEFELYRFFMTRKQDGAPRAEVMLSERLLEIMYMNECKRLRKDSNFMYNESVLTDQYGVDECVSILASFRRLFSELK